MTDMTTAGRPAALLRAEYAMRDIEVLVEQSASAESIAEAVSRLRGVVDVLLSEVG